MKKTLKITFFRKYILLLAFIFCSDLIYGVALKDQDPNKDKLLIEIISYVIKRGHYDPREINDSFSENVFMNYLEN